MSDMAPETNSRISVSRDALRADLAEMELRLKVYLDAAIASKASQFELDRLTETVSRNQRGEFTQAQVLAIRDIVSTTTANAWVLRNNKIAVIVGLSSFIGLACSLVLLAHYLGWWS